MSATGTTPRELAFADFFADPHATKYRGELKAHPDAFVRLFALLNDSANEQRLVDAEMHGLPALAGVVRFVESDPAIAEVLTGDGGFRFRQTVGVAVKLKMAKLGWRTTGRKGSVKGARHFTKAQHYEAGLEADPAYAQRALAALDAMERMGDENERSRTLQELMDGLAATRAEEGRPF